MVTTLWKPFGRRMGVWILLVQVGCGPRSPTEPTAGEAFPVIPALSAQTKPVTGTAEILVVTGLTVDANGGTVIPVAADPSTPLYYRRTGLPILGPDGHHITAGEFRAVQGSISVTCLKSGTHVAMHFRDLIPNGTYRIWLLSFRSPGFDLGPPPDFANLVAEGALGPNDRSRNTFTASASGEGQITRIHPAGHLSETLPEPPFANEPVGRCLLTDEFEWHVVGALQQPGQPQGEDVGTPGLFPGTAVEQFTFIFR